MDRKPPTRVRQQLRQEVGYGCPVPGCGRPYLEWHHFDPPWRERQHHDPAGMIALCSECHPKADAGAYTVEQLHEFKRDAAAHAKEVVGRFDWLRRDIAIVTGSVIYVECGVAVEVRGKPTIWFRRDDGGYALLNVRMPQTSPSQRVVIEDNFWIKRGNVADLVCPPGGKTLDVAYRNGDRLRIEFEEIPDETTLKSRHPAASAEVELPLTTVEVTMAIPALDLSFDSRNTRIGTSSIGGGLIRHCGIGLSIN